MLKASPGRTLLQAGLHWTTDDGRTWRRAAAVGLRGRLLGLAPHPGDPRTIAAGTDQGLYLSADCREAFAFLLLEPNAATSVAFDHSGDTLFYSRAVRRTLIALRVSTGQRHTVRLPPMGVDYVSHLAVSPADGGLMAIATDRRHIYLSSDSGRTWRQIAKDGDLP